MTEVNFFWKDPEGGKLYLFARADLPAVPRQGETVELLLENRLDEQGHLMESEFIVERVIHYVHNTLPVGPEPKPFKHDPERYPNWIFVFVQPVDEQARRDLAYMKEVQVWEGDQSRWRERNVKRILDEYNKGKGGRV